MENPFSAVNNVMYGKSFEPLTEATTPRGVHLRSMSAETDAGNYELYDQRRVISGPHENVPRFNRTVAIKSAESSLLLSPDGTVKVYEPGKLGREIGAAEFIAALEVFKKV